MLSKRNLYLTCFVLFIFLLFPASAKAAEMSPKTLKECYRLNTRYANAQKGGIALAGSSTLARWKTAAQDISGQGTFSESEVYNYGISGATFQELLDPRYISLVARQKPSVVIMYGANSLTVSRKKTSRNRSISVQATNASVKFIEKLRAALRRQGKTDTRFLFVSTVKTPWHYKYCKAKRSSCNIWDRIDLFNKRMKKYANSVSYCEYIDIEPYYYYTFNGSKETKKLRYYLDEGNLRRQSNAAAAKSLISRKMVSPLFSYDLNHPSVKAYDLIWSKIALRASAF